MNPMKMRLFIKFIQEVSNAADFGALLQAYKAL
jgi:hypothetical protein